jgi:hypothetical protein
MTLHELAAYLTALSRDEKNPQTQVLWQTLGKDDIAQDAPDADWDAFVKAWEAKFADDASMLAKDAWDEHTDCSSQEA